MTFKRGEIMGDVVQFPSNTQQGMKYLEDGIRELMLIRGESEEQVKITLKILKDVYSQYGDIGRQSFQLTLPSYLQIEHVKLIQLQIADGINLLNKEHASIINKLASELVLTKLKLYRLEEKQRKDSS